MIDTTVWVVDDDTSIAWVLDKALSKQGYHVERFESGEAALLGLDKSGTPKPDVMLSDVRMAGMTGFELADKITEQLPNLPVIIMTAFGDLDSAVDAYKHGAFEYLTKPFDIKEMTSLVDRALQKTSSQSSESISSTQRLMLGESAAMQEVFRIIGRLSSTEMNVLIRGESGTGKELVAEAIYQNSPRSAHPLVAINTAAIPSELLESELFGHEKGAFTGAHSRHIGRFEQANNGTLFLDEIGDMPAGLQTRLLRVLSEGRFYRVGGRDEVKVDVRVIAATNQNLEALVDSGLFRADLFHRLNVISIQTPALRERSGDIPLLVNHFMALSALEPGAEKKHCAPEVLRALQNYEWPGNVRELENLVKRLTVLAPSLMIQLDDLPSEVMGGKSQSEGWEESLGRVATEQLEAGEAGLMQSLGAKFESTLIKAAMAKTGGHKQKAAILLGWGRNTLTRKLQQLNLQDT
ncbi:MAG: nitrogen regulation protein NR(I) [Acidiferrobacterales bacterium]|nr:nitrogen regulation protein NR(I) [Acidiferrobacterales bacterium]